MGVTEMDFKFGSRTSSAEAENKARALATTVFDVPNAAVLYAKSERECGPAEYAFPNELKAQFEIVRADPTSMDTLFDSIETALVRLKVLDQRFLSPRPTIRARHLAIRNLFGDRGAALGCVFEDQ